LATKRLAHLTTLRTSAENIGDVHTLAVLEQNISETEATLEKLKSLSEFTE
jgi:ferritin-like metal-binding protein YciE